MGVTALFLASKYEDIYPPSITEMIYVSADTYTNQQVRQMEIDILRVLDYQLGRPTPLTFLRHYSKLMGTTTLVHNLAKYFIEASYLSPECRALLPSQCAVGALVLASKVLTRRGVASIWSPLMENYTWYSHRRAAVFAEKVLGNVMSYYSFSQRESGSRYEAVMEKYTNNFNSAAAHPRLFQKLQTLTKAPKFD